MLCATNGFIECQSQQQPVRADRKEFIVPAPTDAEYFELGDVTLQSGFTLRNATLAYKSYGTLNADKTNVIVYPTWYSGWHTDNEWLIGTDKTLNPDEWFIIVPNMLGNGLSSSPSNMPAPYDRARFPAVTFYDQVEAQHKLVTEKFGISTIALVTGWSMGAGQTYQWAVSHPEMVQRAAPFCGSSITAPHNKVFLESLIYALTADAVWADGDYSPDRLPIKGLRAFARVYSGWASRRRSIGRRRGARWASRHSTTFSTGFGRTSSAMGVTPTI